VVGTTFAKQFIHTGREFVFLKYWIFFRPRHGTIIGIFPNRFYHHTRQNIGFIQVGVALIVKVKVAFAGAKR
jgi:hypothetical protein